MPMPLPYALFGALLCAAVIYVLYSRMVVDDLRRDRTDSDPITRAYATRAAAAAQVAAVGYAVSAAAGVVPGLMASSVLPALGWALGVAMPLAFAVTVWWGWRQAQIRRGD